MECCRVALERCRLELVWFDSLGAKSASILFADAVLVDPGAAAMQPSYPLSGEAKAELRRRAVEAIAAAAKRAKIIVVTHYHYDHHLRPSDPVLAAYGGPAALYAGKTIYAKDPNTFINESQWGRARLFVEELCSSLGECAGELYTEPRETVFPDPVEELVEALSRRFPGYDDRRRQLLERGRRWFQRLAAQWASRLWLRRELVLGGGTRIVFGDRGAYEAGGVGVRLLGPWFHGVEYDRTGWVVPVLLESEGCRVFYTSDVMGPIIEDYASRIIREKPSIVVLDGPPTYLYPYMLNRVNLGRAVENALRIIDSLPSAVVVYDHHLLREKRWRERVAPVLGEAARRGYCLATAAECLGQRPLIDTL